MAKPQPQAAKKSKLVKNTPASHKVLTARTVKRTAGKSGNGVGKGKPTAPVSGRIATTVIEAPDTPEISVQELLNNGEVIPENWRETRSFKLARLAKSDLEHYLHELLRKRGEILGDVTSMEDEALRKTGSGDLSNMPIHMAELGSDNYEQEFTLNLLEHEQKLLTEIEEAILRIWQGNYGVCVATGKPIGKPRLEAKPWAKYCIEYVREQERRGIM